MIAAEESDRSCSRLRRSYAGSVCLCSHGRDAAVTPSQPPIRKPWPIAEERRISEWRVTVGKQRACLKVDLNTDRLDGHHDDVLVLRICGEQNNVRRQDYN
ncbi:hypothetical protein BIW11_09434 [Tropilaelaps mercedesae]|uniref:Uncharacterized protein n=1 Tax=Tropilaelaps mercedesae TaxID=418985 RepID=A0A1V9XKL6_9ACAR|nr:hypothetical protein BIW11_09434 [Tropilaelaps mercedesae]